MKQGNTPIYKHIKLLSHYSNISNNEFDIPSIILERFAYLKPTPKAYMLKISPPPPPFPQYYAKCPLLGGKTLDLSIAFCRWPETRTLNSLLRTVWRFLQSIIIEIASIINTINSHVISFHGLIQPAKISKMFRNLNIVFSKRLPEGKTKVDVHLC